MAEAESISSNGRGGQIPFLGALSETGPDPKSPPTTCGALVGPNQGRRLPGSSVGGTIRGRRHCGLAALARSPALARLSAQ